MQPVILISKNGLEVFEAMRQIEVEDYVLTGNLTNYFGLKLTDGQITALKILLSSNVSSKADRTRVIVGEKKVQQFMGIMAEIREDAAFYKLEQYFWD